MERLGSLFQLFREDSAAGNVVAHLPRLLEPLNLLDVAALCAFLYILLSQLARSPLRRLLNGLLFLLVLFSAVTAFDGLTALNLIIRNSYLVVLVSIPIIFQSEIRNCCPRPDAGSASGIASDRPAARDNSTNSGCRRLRRASAICTATVWGP